MNTYRRQSSLALIALLFGAAAFADEPETPKADAAKPDEKKEEKWDVSKPPFPLSSIPIDVDEGTWMSVDVSPDGKEIVFDLLGDLYTIPIGGGEAKTLTSGMAWDEQPRYSPTDVSSPSPATARAATTSG